MTTTLWTDTFLDDMRNRGDPLADQAVAALYDTNKRDLSRINSLMRNLVSNDQLIPEQLPPEIQEYLVRSAPMLELDPERVLLGEQVFADHGPEILMILGFYSLPFSYSARKGAHVIYDTGLLLQRAAQRLFETMQLVVDMLSPGGMNPTGRAIRSAQKIRLMHAAIRFLLTHDPRRPWDASLGVPINQEDLAGTFTVFTVIVAKYGLEKLGIVLPLEQQDAYLQAWRTVGLVQGIDPRLLPVTMAKVDEMSRIIQTRQVAESEQGRQLTASLIQAMEAILPKPFHGTPTVMMRHFLSEDPYDGRNLATLLGIPPGKLTDLLLEATIRFGEAVNYADTHSSIAQKVIRHVGLMMIEGMLRLERGGNRPPFSIPANLKVHWAGKDAQVA
jgi:hypothetical protein